MRHNNYSSGVRRANATIVRNLSFRLAKVLRAAWLSVVLVVATGVAFGAPTEVIVNPAVEIRRINPVNLRNIYMLRQTHWPNGQPVVVFVMPDDHAVHESFAKQTLGLYPYRLRQTWDRLSFSGMARPPVEVRDENEMRARVRATPGAIGYITKDTGNESIKTLRLE